MTCNLKDMAGPWCVCFTIETSGLAYSSLHGERSCKQRERLAFFINILMFGCAAYMSSPCHIELTLAEKDAGGIPAAAVRARQPDGLVACLRARMGAKTSTPGSTSFAVSTVPEHEHTPRRSLSARS